MLAYKGFNPGLICRNYQFEMGLNITDKANCRENGFHCAADPLDCLTYYSDMDHSEYYLVDAGGDIDEDGNDSKISCTHLTILRRLDRKEFFLHALAYMVDHPLQKWNHHVRSECGEARNGVAIVRGIAPRASGQMEDILALAKEDPVSRRIVQVGLAVVDGIKVMPGIWYDVDLSKAGVQ